MLLLGDCRTVLPTLDAASVQSCLTHPPYWQAHGETELGGESTRLAYQRHVVDALHGVRRVLRPDGDLWLLLDSRAVIPALVADGWRLTSTIPYGTEWLIHFGPTAPPCAPLPALPPDEVIMQFDHYTPWSAALVTRCLEASTQPGDLVLDPMMGIGTTGRVALRAGRRFVGIERSLMTYAAAVAYVRYHERISSV